MTDRELLELAAKAAKMEGYEYSCTDQGGHECMAFDEGGSQSDYWNPLTDDGDALRLAVKLCLTIEIADYGTGARRGSTGKWKGCEAHIYQGSERATRYAIVLAAAEIGKSLP